MSPESHKNGTQPPLSSLPPTSSRAASAEIVSRPIGTCDERITRTVGESLAAEAAAATLKAAFLGKSEELLVALKAKAEAEVDASIPPPVSPESSLVDQLAVENLTSLVKAKAEAREEAVKSAAEVRARRDWVASCPKTMRAWALVVIYALTVLLVGGAAVVLGTMAGFTLNVIIGPLVQMSLGEGYERFAATLSWALGIGAVALLLVPQAFAVLGTSGNTSGRAKIGFVAADLLFAASFALSRGSVGATSYQGIGFSLIEAGLSLVVTVVLLVIGAALKTNAGRRQTQSLAEQLLAAAVTEDELRRSAVNACDEAHSNQLAVLERRDYLNRMAQKFKTWASATVTLPYIVETSAMIAEAAGETAADRALDETVGAYATAQGRQFGLVNGHDKNGEVNRG